jgi:hypothetical protein
MDSGTVLLLVGLVALPLAAVLFVGGFGLLDQLGRGGLSVEEPVPAARPMRPLQSIDAAAVREREEEIRQLVQARHDRQLARGERPVDIEQEVGRLMQLDPSAAPEQDRQQAALREEVRQHVVARNERRIARGEPALDVEAEIERQIRSL